MNGFEEVCHSLLLSSVQNFTKSFWKTFLFGPKTRMQFISKKKEWMIILVILFRLF